jgi:hypothetical protein
MIKQATKRKLWGAALALLSYWVLMVYFEFAEWQLWEAVGL